MSGRGRGRLAAAALLALPVLLASIGCDNAPENAVAVVAGEPVTLADLERYLDANLAHEDDIVSGEPDEAADEVKSRLYDALIDERLLVAEAEARGIEVTDVEVRFYLDAAVDPAVEDVPDDVQGDGPDPEVEARRRLLVEKLQEEALRDTEPPTAADVQAHLDANRDRFQPGRMIELRAIAVPSEGEAKRLAREITRRRMTFNEAVVLHRQDPGQGAAMTMSEATLPDAVREALADVKRGGVAGPIEMNGEIYLFQLVSRIEPTSRGADELLRDARQDLEARRRRDAYDRLLAEVRRRYGVRRLTGRLPFPYVPDRPDE